MDSDFVKSPLGAYEYSLFDNVFLIFREVLIAFDELGIALQMLKNDSETLETKF